MCRSGKRICSDAEWRRLSSEEKEGSVKTLTWRWSHSPAANGSGHQEVDMTGAHYEIVRRSCLGAAGLARVEVSSFP